MPYSAARGRPRLAHNDMTQWARLQSLEFASSRVLHAHMLVHCPPLYMLPFHTRHNCSSLSLPSWVPHLPPPTCVTKASMTSPSSRPACRAGATGTGGGVKRKETV